MLQTKVSQPRLRDFHAVNGYLPPRGALRALELGWQRLVPCVSNLRRSAVCAIGGDAISGSAPRPSGTGGLQTLCWREMDSNHQSRGPAVRERSHSRRAISARGRTGSEWSHLVLCRRHLPRTRAVGAIFAMLSDRYQRALDFPSRRLIRIRPSMRKSGYRYSSPQSPIICIRSRDFARTRSITSRSPGSSAKPKTRVFSAICCATPRRAPTMTPATTGRSRM